MDEGRLFLCLFLCLLATVKGKDILCEQGFCRDYGLDVGCSAPTAECRINNATHSGMWLPSPTTCNCCEFCLPFYGAGEYCSRGGPGTGFTVGRCGDGLTCVDTPDGHSYCARMRSECHDKQDSYDQRQEAGTTFAMEMRPHCDGKGKYAVVDCVPANTCFCQSEEGDRIFGEVLYLGTTTIQNMHCGCSRLHAKIESNLAPGLSLPVIGPRCTSDGNFNPVQCIDRECYCVDKITGEVQYGEGKSVDLDEHPISKLVCYEAALDLFPQHSVGDVGPYNYTTPCFEDMLERIELIKESQEAGFNVDYFTSVPRCMPDGTYGRVVQRNAATVCVDERGIQIGNYSVPSNSPEAANMDCNCALTSLTMATSTEKPVCCRNGNFRKIQCRRGLCRCVDSDGRQIERESADVTSLSCYEELETDWKTC